MCRDVEPFSIPAQNTAPHLVVLVSRDLALEAALHGAEHDANGALDGLVGFGVENDLVLGVAGEYSERLAEEVRDEMCSGDVEVGKVGRVRLVEVIVDLEKGGMAGRDDGLEEGIGTEFRGLAQESVVDKGVEDAVLELVSTIKRTIKRETLTVQARGIVFQLKMTKNINRILDVRPGPVRKALIMGIQFTR